MSYESIVQFAISEESSKQAYNSLALSLIQAGVKNKEESLAYLKEGEDRYMEEFCSDVPEAKKKGGGWKYRSYLPGAYSSAKSVLSNALEAGVSLTDEEGKVKGKTALEKETKTLKGESAPELPPFEIAISYLNKLANVWNSLDSDERADIQDRFYSFQEGV